MINLMTNEREMLQSSSISNLFGTISTITAMTAKKHKATSSEYRNAVHYQKEYVAFR